MSRSLPCMNNLPLVNLLRFNTSGKYWNTPLIRLCAALGGAVLITIILVTLMVLMVMSSGEAPDTNKTYKIADIWQADRIPSEFVKPPKPEKLPEPLAMQPTLPKDQVPGKARSTHLPAAAISLEGIPTPTSTFNIGLGGGFVRDTDYIPVYVPQPLYPRRALSRNKEGYAIVQVIITATGGVRNIRLLEESPKNYGFGNAALKAAVKLKYNPRVIDGRPIEVPGVMYKFSFRLE